MKIKKSVLRILIVQISDTLKTCGGDTTELVNQLAHTKRVLCRLIEERKIR